MSVLGRSKSTCENYGHHLAAIALHFGHTPLELDAEDIQEYLYELQNRSKTPSQTCFKHTIFGLRFLLKSEGLPYEFLLLPSIKKDNKLPVVLSKEEVWRMLRSCKLLKHRILVGMIYGCGLRCFEVCNVRLCDLDFDRSQLHVVQGKGKKDRYLPLSPHLIRGLRSYIASERPHTFATHLLEDGLDIVTVKELMGHSRIQTTMEYLHVVRSNPQRAFSPIDTLFEQCAVKQK